MKEQNEKEKKIRKKPMNKEKRFYLLTALGCAAALIAIVTVAIVVSTGDVNQAGNGGGTNNESTLPPASNDNGGNENSGNNGEQGNTGGGEQVVVKPEGMIMPMETVSLINDYGFYHNKTLNSYYEHVGLDFSAEAGTQVLAVEEGTIESIYKDDLLTGTEIVIDHGDGLKSVYRFVTEAEGLKVGDSVEKGEVIATVAEANGSEYKDGAHLHFEILENGKNVDPATLLTLEEK
ncbi:MAG: M23 family metallopeptidase [Clostridia bacterium]|nr:M23 family metallopeptidase [Clostridia bacterium]